MQLQFRIFPNYLFMQLQFLFLPELILHKYSLEGYIGEGDSDSEGYRLDLFQDVPDQGRQAGPMSLDWPVDFFCKVRSLKIFAAS